MVCCILTAVKMLCACFRASDADKFSKEMEIVIFCSEAAQERLATAKVDYLKAAETDGANDFLCTLAQESAERFHGS